jgi:hypothetical protein
MVWGSNPGVVRFSAPDQTGPGAQPASYTMGTGFFPGVKRPGRDVDDPPPSSAEVKERVELHLYVPSGLSWPVLGRTSPSPLPYSSNHRRNLDNNMRGGSRLWVLGTSIYETVKSKRWGGFV